MGKEICSKLGRKKAENVKAIVDGNSIAIPPNCFCSQSLSLRIGDSCRMLPSSLDTLAQNLRSRVRPKNCVSCKNDTLCSSCELKELPEKVFPHTERHIRENFGEEHIEKFFGKQIFCHSYVTGLPSLMNTTSLPAKNHFKTGMNSNEEVSQEKYDQALELWQITGCRNLLDFSVEY